MSIKDDYQEYKSTLNELKMNSKPLINLLTILAEEKISNASQVVRAIEERISEVSLIRFESKFFFYLNDKTIDLDTW